MKFSGLSKISIVLLIVKLIFPFPKSFGQNYISPIDRKIDSLKKTGIDTILNYLPPNGNMIENKGSFQIMDSEYLIWREVERYYIQKFSFCLSEDGSRGYDSTFNAVPLKSVTPVYFFLANLDSLKTQYLRPALTKQNLYGRDTIMEIRSSHPSIRGITFYIGKEIFKNHYYDFQLDDGIITNEDGSIRYKYEMINYDYNMSTGIVKLVQLLQSTVETLENNKAFGH